MLYTQVPKKSYGASDFSGLWSDCLPEWLHAFGWNDDNWELFGKQWLQDIASCFSVETYWETHFHASERLHYAETRATMLDGDEIAARFVVRVQEYLQNMLQELLEDAVSAPSGLSGLL